MSPCRKFPVPKNLCAENSPCRKISALKCACDGMSRNVRDAETSRCRNVQVPKIPRDENSLCRKFFMSKRSRVETSICRNVYSAKRCMRRNGPVMKRLCLNDSCRKVPCRNGLQGSCLSHWEVRNILTCSLCNFMPQAREGKERVMKAQDVS